MASCHQPRVVATTFGKVMTADNGAAIWSGERKERRQTVAKLLIAIYLSTIMPLHTHAHNTTTNSNNTQRTATTEVPRNRHTFEID